MEILRYGAHVEDTGAIGRPNRICAEVRLEDGAGRGDGLGSMDFDTSSDDGDAVAIRGEAEPSGIDIYGQNAEGRAFPRVPGEFVAVAGAVACGEDEEVRIGNAAIGGIGDGMGLAGELKGVGIKGLSEERRAFGPEEVAGGEVGVVGSGEKECALREIGERGDVDTVVLVLFGINMKENEVPGEQGDVAVAPFGAGRIGPGENLFVAAGG